jgi:NDP-mannose synthase
MKAVILCGGEGKRLRPYTYILPKPLLPIGDKAILEIILERLKEQGIMQVILATNYKEAYIKTFLSDGKDKGMDIVYSKEDNFLGTAGPLKALRDMFKEDFFVMNGDLLTNLDISDLSKFHKENSGDITIVTKIMKTPIHYGVIENKEGVVTKWTEKPDVTFEISTGMYMLNPKVLDYLPEGKPFNMDELVREVLKNNGKVLRFLYDGEWVDIGRVEDYEKIQSGFNEK